MTTVPCPRCGYHAPEEACPHCGEGAREASVARRTSGPLLGIVDGLWAVPKGLWLLARTRGIKRWLVPPLIVTSALLVAALWWTFSLLDGLMARYLPGELDFDEEGWGWLQGLSERWAWAKATWQWLVVAAEWLVNTALVFVTSKPLRLLGYFLLGSLVTWYCFSIAYEAFAGPFLDEIQGRLEATWFGSDPRSRLERPNDLPAERCIRLTTWAAAGGSLLFLAALWVPAVPWWGALFFAPLGLLPPIFAERRYGPWLFWVARVEARAAWASLQASILTAILLVLALPLYFVPAVGYFLFAAITGFATAVGLLDIPFERRGWRLGQRVRFLGRNLLPMLAFGVVAGLLLSIPILGAVLMVPSASLGGMWLVCRLDKAHLRPAPAAPGRPTEPQESARDVHAG